MTIFGVCLTSDVASGSACLSNTSSSSVNLKGFWRWPTMERPRACATCPADSRVRLPTPLIRTMPVLHFSSPSSLNSSTPSIFGIIKSSMIRVLSGVRASRNAFASVVTVHCNPNACAAVEMNSPTSFSSSMTRILCLVFIVPQLVAGRPHGHHRPDRECSTSSGLSLSLPITW